MTKPVSGQTTFGSNTSGTTTQLDNNFLLAYNALNDLNTYQNYLTDTGAANAYAVTLGAGLTGALTDGLQIQVKFSATNTGASVINYNATGNANIVNPNGTALTTNQIKANAILPLQYSTALSSWELQTPSYTQSFITASMGSDVNLNNTGTYFDGPSVSQGTVGTWWAEGSVTVTDTAGAAAIIAKLWDGTTVIASGEVTTQGAGSAGLLALSGPITSPAGNIRISCKDITSTSGLIKFNISGNAKDSTLSVKRVA